MHFTQFTLHNFGPFEHMDLKLQQGSVGIFGPNGSGKTTVLNALYGCVTNDFGRFDGVKADCIRNTCEAKTESYIYGRVVHSGTVLSIKRSLYPAKTSVVIDEGKEITDANKAQEEIYRVLGVDRDMLKMYAFKPQDGIYDFISAEPAARARAFAVLCRTEGCEAIWDYLGKFLGKSKEVNEVINDNSDELVTEIAALTAKISEIVVASGQESMRLLNDQSEQTAREILRKQDRLEDLHTQLQKEQRLLTDATESMQDARARLEKREKKWQAIKTQVEEQQETADESRASLKAWQQYAKYRARRRQLRDELEYLQQEEKQHAPPEPRTGDPHLDELIHICGAWKRQVKEIQAALTTLEATGLTACPTCGTSVANLHDHITGQKELLKTLPGDIKKVEAQICVIREYQADTRSWEKWKASYDARLSSNQQAREALKGVEAPDGTEEEYTAVVVQYDGLVKDCAEAKQSYDEAVTRCSELDAQGRQAKRRVGEINVAIEENTEDPERVKRVRMRLDEHIAATKAVARLQGQQEGVQQQIASKEGDLQRLKAKLKRSKRVRRTAAITEEVRELMHRDLLPRLVAQGNLSKMEGDINEGLSFFGDPFWIESDENLTFVAHKPGEPSQPAARLSTGQRVVLALAFWPAVASLWSEDLGILALDEPTANLDEVNRKFLSDALGTLTARVRGRRQLIMVTHDPNLRTAFDQVIDIGG